MIKNKYKPKMFAANKNKILKKGGQLKCTSIIYEVVKNDDYVEILMEYSIKM